MTAHDAAWYDVAMTDPEGPAMLELRQSPWLQLYTEVAKLIEPHEPVVDLGAGTGRFIRLLLEREHYAPIQAVDWSRAALEEIINYNAVQLDEPTQLELLEADLDDWQPRGDRAGGTVYVCTEVLEHLERDTHLIRRIPPGHRFIFSVPNYWSESHEMWYGNPGAVWDRYSMLLTFSRWVMIPIQHPIKHVHLFETRRRSDSW